ncbi:uncharacterized protein BXIN_2502 [Babesia sp. Xinjiang]|uniref:uncharacterized protein n=1 Tax=Babesia sp. Xinjiang TaxID=462227 RepID=UPI000A218375|nr:uncharacterized protein BXIN_2502 [Babesia sp. Xinjiang]ORM41425.1 hypothetical protein BXIN_2502 [Babesia sp. Xinjiang]
MAGFKICKVIFALLTVTSLLGGNVVGDEVTQEVAVEVPKRESANLSGDNNEPAQKKSWMPRCRLPWSEDVEWSPEVAQQRFQQVLERVSKYDPTEESHKPYEEIFKGLTEKADDILPDRIMMVLGRAPPGVIPLYLSDRLSAYLAYSLAEKHYGPRPVHWRERITWDRHRDMLQSFIKEALKGPAPMEFR